NSCTEDDVVTGDDNILNYEIPIEPVASDYLVGAQYSRFVRRSTVPEEPSIGIYNGNIADPFVYEQHVNQANTAGIDFFIFQFRSANNSNANNQDATFINDLQTASNSQDLNFALSYNFGNMGLNNNNRIEDLGLVQRFVDDFKLMIPFFDQPNYMKINGKNVVYMFNSFNLHSNDNAALYQLMRDELSAMGVELYLIGMQPQWTPTLRFDFRFVNGIDAVTHTPYAIINQNDYDRYTFFHRIVNLAWEYHKETWLNYNIEYIPTIAPSVNLKLINSGSPTYVIDKNEEWFRAHCNVARRAVGSNRIVLLDSFNDWNRGTQVESADTYADEFLNILREEFKVN
ncbi:glycoside hydrolase family 99-like domain-containing protein, partial [Flavobacteriaceae bacterium]|nr:glycoside hydrolase family 99-like domain-containing protein [Flavobacteriaceae bacterium]